MTSLKNLSALVESRDASYQRPVDRSFDNCICLVFLLFILPAQSPPPPTDNKLAFLYHNLSSILSNLVKIGQWFKLICCLLSSIQLWDSHFLQCVRTQVFFLQGKKKKSKGRIYPHCLLSLCVYARTPDKTFKSIGKRRARTLTLGGSWSRINLLINYPTFLDFREWRQNWEI